MEKARILKGREGKGEDGEGKGLRVGRSLPPQSCIVRVRGSSNGLTNHRGGDVYRGC